MKICPKCNQEKSLDSFAKCSTRKDGLQLQCKTCKIQQNREKGYTKKHYIDNPDKKLLRDNRAKTFYSRNPGSIKKAIKKYRKNNPNKIKEISEKYTQLIPPGVYAIKCLINGKMYIGESQYPIKRRAAHLSIAKSDKTLTSTNDWLQEDIQKYGKKCFVFGIVEETLDHKNRELYWIKYFKANNIELYNG
jgi:hypothetical protein